MYFREHIQNKLQSGQARLKQLKFWVNRGQGDISEMIKSIEECNDLLEDIKSIVEREPMTPNEYNKF